MPLFIRIVAAGLEEGEQPSIAQNVAMMVTAFQQAAFVPPSPVEIPPPPVSPFLTPTLTLS